MIKIENLNGKLNDVEMTGDINELTSELCFCIAVVGDNIKNQQKENYDWYIAQITKAVIAPQYLDFGGYKNGI